MFEPLVFTSMSRSIFSVEVRSLDFSEFQFKFGSSQNWELFTIREPLKGRSLDILGLKGNPGKELVYSFVEISNSSDGLERISGGFATGPKLYSYTYLDTSFDT